MNIKINVVLFSSPDNIEIFPINVEEKNAELIKKKLNTEKTKMIDYLINLYEIGQIKSIRRPKNKSIQYQLNDIINAKKTIKKSINILNTLYR